LNFGGGELPPSSIYTPISVVTDASSQRSDVGIENNVELTNINMHMQTPALSAATNTAVAPKASNPNSSSVAVSGGASMATGMAMPMPMRMTTTHGDATPKRGLDFKSPIQQASMQASLGDDVIAMIHNDEELEHQHQHHDDVGGPGSTGTGTGRQNHDQVTHTAVNISNGNGATNGIIMSTENGTTTSTRFSPGTSPSIAKGRRGKRETRYARGSADTASDPGGFRPREAGNDTTMMLEPHSAIDMKHTPQSTGNMQ